MPLRDRWRRAWARVFWRKAAFNSLLSKFDALTRQIETLGVWIGGGGRK